MIKIKTTLLGSALAVALSVPAMAADFHALVALGATPAPLQDEVLASTEGGVAICGVPTSANTQRADLLIINNQRAGGRFLTSMNPPLARIRMGMTK